MNRNDTAKAMHDAVALLQRERDMVYESEDDGSGNIPDEARRTLDEFDDVIVRLRAAHIDFMVEFIRPAPGNKCPECGRENCDGGEQDCAAFRRSRESQKGGS